jgi:5-azacytidine-induced protein 1
MRRWKDVFLASEKVKRQKWEQEKIAEIKAVTIKGLEPELQRLVERQKEDSRLQALQHEDELAQLRLSLT